MQKYYRVNYYKRNIYILEIMDEDFKIVDRIQAVQDNYNFLYKETLLPLDLTDMTQVCTGLDSVFSLHKTKQLTDKYYEVLEYRDLTDKQLETICDPKKYK